MKRKTLVKELYKFAKKTNNEEAILFLDLYCKNYPVGTLTPSKKRKKTKHYKSVDGKTPGQVRYAEYLESSQWKKIRKKVFENKGEVCEGCGSTVKLQVHHSVYSKRVLDGDSLNGLRVVCPYCHKKIHETVGKNMSLRQATKFILDDKKVKIKKDSELDTLKKMLKNIK